MVVLHKSQLRPRLYEFIWGIDKLYYDHICFLLNLYMSISFSLLSLKPSLHLFILSLDFGAMLTLVIIAQLVLIDFILERF